MEPVTTLKPFATNRSGASLRHQEGESQGIPLVQQFSSVFEEQSPLRAGQEQSERWTDNQRKKKRLQKKKKIFFKKKERHTTVVGQ